MAFDFGYSDKSGDDFEVFMSSIENESKMTEKEMLKTGAEVIKENVVANLNKHRRVIAVRYKNRPAMADDVVIRRRTGKYGDKYIRVMGGRMTGTLWHLVNDGNLHSTPTHFMDNALAKLDGSIDDMWDKAMGDK